MKKILLLFGLCLTLILCFQPRNLQNLRLLSPECNNHGYFFKGQCFCQSQWTGPTCGVSSTHGTYDDLDDKCDDLYFRLDNLVNISPEFYDMDDDEFPRLTGNSIGEGDAAYGDKGSSWIKMTEIVENGKFKIIGNIDTTDVKQGSLGNCYLLAAFASLSTVRNGEVIKNAFVTQTDNEKHVYVTRWLIDGKPRFVAVDQWIPGSGKTPSFSKLTEDNELWAIILEKAWAKIHGNYMRTQGGWHTNVWKSLSQAPVYSAGHKDKKFDADTVYNYVRNLLDQEFAVGSATVMIAKTNEVGGHAYSILDAVTVKLDNGSTEKLFRMYNPWNSEVWKENPWGDESSVWTPSLKSQVKYVNQNDGQFYVSTKDYLENFGMINWAEIQRNFDVAFQDIALSKTLDESKEYTAQFNYKGSGKPLYVSVDVTDSRLQMGCGQPWDINNLKVVSPSGKAFETNRDSDGMVIKIENAESGVYIVTAEIRKKKAFASYFTITTYSAVDSVTFIPKKDNEVKYDLKKCPNDCNKKGRCNMFKGVCHCYFPNAGTQCLDKLVQKCPNDCSGNGVCDTLYGNCKCNPGFTGVQCDPCQDTYERCEGYVNDGCCNPTDKYFYFTKDHCQKSCGEKGFKEGFENCYVEKGKPTPTPVNKCQGVSCSRNGNCDERNGKCVCYNGFSGNNCENKIKPEPQPEPKPQPKPEPEPTPTCKDELADCKPYVDADYCKLHRENMEYYCKKSCKFC